MVELRETDYKKYEAIGSGDFGTVFKVDDEIAYKIYHRTIEGDSGFEIMNPAILVSESKLKRLQARGKKVEHTGLIRDYIKINGTIRGVVIPYYDGITLRNLVTHSYRLRKSIAQQLVRNHEELLIHRIYPLDYHTGNIMIENNQARIVDLDDPRTHVCWFPDLVHHKLSTRRLNETICRIFKDQNPSYSKKVDPYLEHKIACYSSSLDWLDAFLTEREQITDYLLIDINSNRGRIKDLLSSHPYRVLFILRDYIWDYDQIIGDIKSFREDNISIYDVLAEGDEDAYLSNFPVKEKVLVKEDSIQALTNKR